MNNRRNSILLTGMIVISILTLAGLTWANFRYTSKNPGGNDFLARWEGTRLYLMKGQSPYSQQTTDEIQKLYYGRLARSGEDQVLFVYPFYSFILISPFAMLKDFATARAVWMTVLEVSIFGLCGIGLALARWRVSAPMLGLLVLFTALWYHSVRPVINGNASILVALFIGLAFLAIRSNHDFLAGFLLAWATIKPQMVVLLILFILIWAISQQRWSLFWSFLGSLAFLVASTSLLIGDWIIQNVRQILSYPQYTLPGTPGAIFATWMPGVGNQMGWALTILMIAILIVEWRAALGQDFRWFLWTASLTLVITNLIGIRTATANYIAMYPALILVFALWDERWPRVGRWLVLISILTLLVGLWTLFLKTLTITNQPVQNPVMFFPLPIFLLIGLYWVRWWAIHPPLLYLDRLRSLQDGELS